MEGTGGGGGGGESVSFFPFAKHPHTFSTGSFASLPACLSRQHSNPNPTLRIANSHQRLGIFPRSLILVDVDSDEVVAKKHAIHALDLEELSRQCTLALRVAVGADLHSGTELLSEDVPSWYELQRRWIWRVHGLNKEASPLIRREQLRPRQAEAKCRWDQGRTTTDRGATQRRRGGHCCRRSRCRCRERRATQQTPLRTLKSTVESERGLDAAQTFHLGLLLVVCSRQKIILNEMSEGEPTAFKAPALNRVAADFCSPHLYIANCGKRSGFCVAEELREALCLAAGLVGVEGGQRSEVEGAQVRDVGGQETLGDGAEQRAMFQQPCIRVQLHANHHFASFVDAECASKVKSFLEQGCDGVRGAEAQLRGEAVRGEVSISPSKAEATLSAVLERKLTIRYAVVRTDLKARRKAAKLRAAAEASSAAAAAELAAAAVAAIGGGPETQIRDVFE